MLHRIAATHLPFPQDLRSAVATNDVALTFAEDGSVVYVVRPGCPNKPAVLAAIETRKRWELWVAGAEGVAAVVVLVGLTALATR